MAKCAEFRKRNANQNTVPLYLGEAVSQWRTPCERDWHPSQDHQDRDDAQVQLAHQVKRAENWLTPNVMDALDARSPEELTKYQDRSRPGRTTAPTLREQLIYGNKEHWPTPSGQANEDHTGKIGGYGELGMAVRYAEEGSKGVVRLNQRKPETQMQWQTPSAENFRTRGGDRADEMGAECAGTRHSRGINDTLYSQTRAWATPASRDVKGANAKPCSSRGRDTEDQLPNQVAFSVSEEQRTKESLNPAWEEILMGWPVGWTDPENVCTGVWPGWPMGQGKEQHAYEPARTLPREQMKHRTMRVKACGNGVVPQCAAAAFTRLLQELLA